MSESVQVKDYRGLKELTPEQVEKLSVSREADQQDRQRHSAAAGYTFVDQQVRAKLTSGFEIPLVGLGTW